jgi:hypothetical protein
LLAEQSSRRTRYIFLMFWRIPSIHCSRLRSGVDSEQHWVCRLREGISIGVTVLTRPIVQPFDDSHIALVTTFADQAVIAIQNVKLFEDVQARTRDLQESLEQQTATSNVLQVISSSPGELKPVFQALLVCSLTGRERWKPIARRSGYRSKSSANSTLLLI